MIRHDVLSALRQLRSQPGFTFLNIFGLTLGMTCFLLLFLWIKNELGYDRFFDDAEQIYRVTTDINLRSGQTKLYAYSTEELSGALLEQFPEVTAAARLRPVRQLAVKWREQMTMEDNFVFADSGFFDVFSFSLEGGNRDIVLQKPRSLLLSRNAVNKFFPDQDPLGKTLELGEGEVYTITGVLGDAPPNSHLQFDFVANPGEEDIFNTNNWQALSLFTYIRLAKGTDAALFEERIQDVIEKNLGPRGREFYRLRLQPLVSIHLHSDKEGEFSPLTDVLQLYLFSAVGILILIVACINYINLATARAGRRALEVGVRKTLGARRRRLAGQFLSEAAVFSLLALILSLGLIILALPSFNGFALTGLTFSPGSNLVLLFILFAAVGILSGFYPALLLSSFSPAGVLRGKMKKG
ncbi:MAG: ABC transporter permease, partial [Candidatus Aminicenantes bacterium]|nr:ABC transporter permease [Candidatus Aminicenantes bacterium]